MVSTFRNLDVWGLVILTVVGFGILDVGVRGSKFQGLSFEGWFVLFGFFGGVGELDFVFFFLLRFSYFRDFGGFLFGLASSSCAVTMTTATAATAAATTHENKTTTMNCRRRCSCRRRLRCVVVVVVVRA